EWNPQEDPHITNRFSARDLSGKRLAKRALLKSLKLLPDMKRPLLGIVSRFASQKGFDLVEAIAPELAEMDLAMAVLGSGDSHYEQVFRGMAEAHPEKFAVRVGYDNELAHRIEAGADIFLMPSQYEPCGLNQMYSLRYGTVPIVRAVGGLDDTVETFDVVSGQGNGYKFGPYRADRFLERIYEALLAYAQPETWRKIQLNGMTADNSWENAASKYQELYSVALHGYQSARV